MTLETLTYTLSGTTLTQIVQERGDALLTTQFDFQPNGLNITTETIVGTSVPAKVYHFANGVYIGASNPAGELPVQVLGENYRPQAQADANGNQTTLDWTTGGAYLNSVTDALNHQTSFNYNIGGASDGTLDYSLDAQGRKTEYTYGDSNNPRLPTRVKVLDTDGTTMLHWQEFVYDSQGRTLEENTYDPSNGTTLLSQVTHTYGTSGNENGLLVSLTQIDLLDAANNVSTTYTYDSAGRVIKTSEEQPVRKLPGVLHRLR